ncbi:hypothetical protein SMICM17S_11426 [Streptomyces microflavus]
MALLNPRALRWKIAALTAAACCAVAAVIGFLVHDATRERGLRVGHERTITRLIAAERELSRTGKAPPDVDVRTREELPDPLARDLADQPETGGGYATWYDADPPNWFWMWGAVAVGGDQFLVVRDDMSTEVRSLQLLDRWPGPDRRCLAAARRADPGSQVGRPRRSSSERSRPRVAHSFFFQSPGSRRRTLTFALSMRRSRVLPSWEAARNSCSSAST